MGIGTLLVGMAIFILVIVLVCMPLLEKTRVFTTAPDELSTLLEERRQVIHSVRELDTDYRMHKLDEADYRALRMTLVEHGASVLRQVESLQQNPDRVDREIENAVAMVHERDYLCVVCKNALRKGDQFCAHCGAPVRAYNAPS